MAPDGYDCEPLAVALERAGVEVALDTSERLTSLPAGNALRSLCRVAWADGDRDDLFAWLRLAGSTGTPRGRTTPRRACACAASPRRAPPSASCWRPSRRGRCRS